MTGGERGLRELYEDDPERADDVVFGRRAGRGGRGFADPAGRAAMEAAIGAPIVFAEHLPSGLLPRALAGDDGGHPLRVIGRKAGLTVIGERPLVAETPPPLLDDDVTPTDRFFVRNNGHPPEAPADPDAWQFTIDGEVHRPLAISLGDLKRRFRAVSHVLQLECGGNGRAAFHPPTRGVQWTVGGIGCARWTGVPLAELLHAAGLKTGAVFTGHYGADTPLSGDRKRPTISRGVRIDKALDPHTLVAFEMNGEPLPHLHGGPVRLIVPGWTGSVSQKWLSRIWIRDREHDGPGMLDFAYRTPIVPGIPGGRFDPRNMKLLESMPVRAIVTSIADGQRLPAGTHSLDLRGHAWAGDHAIDTVEVSADYGMSWVGAQVAAPVNRFAWQRWTARLPLPSAGYYELWARARDSAGTIQPFAAANWNPQGYGANPYHRVRIVVVG